DALEGSDALRDALHEAQGVAAALAEAGADWDPDAEGLDAALTAQIEAAQATQQAAQAAQQAARSPEPTAPAPGATSASAAPTSPPEASSRWLALGLLGGLALAIVGWGLYGAGQRSAQPPGPATGRGPLEGQ